MTLIHCITYIVWWWFWFRCYFGYISAKVLNTKVSSRANRISQSLQFINFQKRSSLHWDEVRSGSAWNKGRLFHWPQQGPKAVGTKDTAEMHHSADHHQPYKMRNNLSLDKKPSLLMDPHQTRAHIQLFCGRSDIVTALQSRAVSKGTCYTGSIGLHTPSEQ